MRLTVHVAGVKKEAVEFKSRDGKTLSKEIIKNTLSFQVDGQDEANIILSQLEENKQHGIPVKHFLSNEKMPGLNRKKKKKA